MTWRYFQVLVRGLSETSRTVQAEPAGNEGDEEMAETFFSEMLGGTL